MDTVTGRDRAHHRSVSSGITGLALLACTLGCIGIEGFGDETDSTNTARVETVFDPGEPSYLDALSRDPVGVSAQPPLCEQLSYPCYLEDVPAQVRVAEADLEEQILQAHQRGQSSEQIAADLAQTPDLAFIVASGPNLSFQLQGGAPRLVVLESMGRERPMPTVGGILGGPLQGPGGTRTRHGALVVDGDEHRRRLLYATVAEWEEGLFFEDTSRESLRASIDRAPSYDSSRSDAVILTEGVDATTAPSTWLSAFAQWRDYPYVMVHAHGAGQTLGSGKTGHTFFVATTFPKTKEGKQECDDYLLESRLKDVGIKGLYCVRFNEFVAIGVSLDTLHSLGSAPLEDTVLNTTSCFFGAFATQASSAGLGELLGGRSIGFGWNGLAQIGWSEDALFELSEFMLADGLRAEDALARVSRPESQNGSTIVLRGPGKMSRARHVVFFADEDGEAIDPAGIGLLSAEYEDGRGWVAPTPVLFSGVLPEETAMFPTNAFVLTQQGQAYFEPDTFNPSTQGFRRGAGEYDYLVPVEIIFGEQAPRHGDRVDIRVETQLPEGGVSGAGGLSAGVGAMLGTGESEGYASFVVARPGCALATMGFGEGGGVGWHNANNVSTVTIPGADVFTVSMARAERVGAGTPDERVEESAPAFSITVTGALPARGDTRTYSPEDVTLTGTAVDGVGSSAYVASGRDDQGSLTLTLTHRDDGSLKGKLGGTSLYPGPDELEPARTDIEFISAPANAPGDFYRCF